MSSSSLPRLSRRLSLAPIQAKSYGLDLEEEGASLLMDMSLTELKKKSPVKGRKARQEQITEDDLDKLSQEELELIAWEAMEEENRLQSRRTTRRISYTTTTTEEPMKNVTIRRKSNTPRKSSKWEQEQAKKSSEVDVEEAIKEVNLQECFAPLPRSTSTSAVKHSYDRQASPSRSALKRPYIRKSVAFGEVAEYEISTGEVEVEATTTSDFFEKAKPNSSNNQALTSEGQSSSPLSRFNNGRAAPLSAAKTVFKANKVPRDSIRRTSTRVKEARLSDAKNSPSRSEISKKTISKLSPKSPIAKTRLRDAVQASAAKSRIKARESAVKAKTKVQTEVKVPNGFRLSSTGTLVAQTKFKPFSVAVVNPTSRGRRSLTNTSATTTSKANPVPAWLKRRKDTLIKEEEERLQKEIERVRAQELAIGQVEEKEKKIRRPTAQPAYTSAVEKRITERATWEAKRKANENLLLQEKEKARQQREDREAEEYRLARQKSVIRANPVPEFIRSRAAK